MSVVHTGSVIALHGDCGVEEAETLLTLIQRHPDLAVDIGGAGSIHTALWQVMMALSPAVIGEPADPIVRQWIAPIVAHARGGGNLPQTDHTHTDEISDPADRQNVEFLDGDGPARGR